MLEKSVEVLRCKTHKPFLAQQRSKKIYFFLFVFFLFFSWEKVLFEQNYLKICLLKSFFRKNFRLVVNDVRKIVFAVMKFKIKFETFRNQKRRKQSNLMKIFTFSPNCSALNPSNTKYRHIFTLLLPSGKSFIHFSLHSIRKLCR